MTILSIVYAPNPIFKKKAEKIETVTDDIRKIADDMLQTMQFERAVGLGANMLGITKAIAVVDLNEGGVSRPYVFINPEIYWKSQETQTFEEASLSFPGISANITRPYAIKIKYLDYDGTSKDLEAEGFFASVIQHEVDYLNGITFLDHLSKMKRDMLIKKMEKFIKQHPPHVHSEHCHH